MDACKGFDCLLALEDSTSIEFKHPTVAKELRHTTSHKHSRGIQVHSVLLFAPEDQQVVGLIEQQRFVVRSMQSRCIEQSVGKLYQFSDTLQSAGERVVHIQQKGGRKARDAK